jgi:radical SAM superfamily enzyme YgiQ (UPF0313 family)
MIVQEKKGKRILLIEPRGNIQYYVLPLALGILKSNLPDYHTVKILDCSYENINSNSLEFKKEIKTFKPQVVGVSCSMQTYPEGIAAVKTAKLIDPKIITVMGGAHPSIFSDMIMMNTSIDFLFRGEGELSFPVFLDLLNGREGFSSVKGLVYRQNGMVLKNEVSMEWELDKIKIPDYDAIRLNNYIEKGYNYGGFYGRTAPIWLTRGCPYACTFCSGSHINGRKIRSHTLQYIVDWINHLYNDFDIRQFAIIDDNFTFYNDYAKEFCRIMINLIKKKHFKEKIYFATPNGVRLDKLDQELLSLMKEAGWQDLTIAPESGSRKTLKRMGKRINPDIVPEVVSNIKKAGLNVRGNFMICYPGETKEDIRETIKLIRKSKFDFFQVMRFMPIPGTPIFNELVRDGEIPSNYMPPHFYTLIFGLGKKEQHRLYSPKDLKNLNTFFLYLRELIFLVLRNPHSIIFFCKYYGIMNVLKKLLFFKEDRHA